MAFGTQFTTNAGNLAAKKRTLAGMAEERFRSIAREQAARMKAVAVQLSSGNLSTAEIRKLGNPYATRFPAGSAPYPDYIINIQSRDFVDGWRSQVRLNGSDWTITLYNNSDHARFMMGGGRSKMRARLILNEVMLRSFPSLPQEARIVVRKVISANGEGVPVGSAWTGAVYAVGVGVVSAVGAVGGSF